MIDWFITIGRFLQIPSLLLRYMLVVALTGSVAVIGTRKYMEYSESFATMKKVDKTQQQILKELKALRLQNDSLKRDQLTLRTERHKDIAAIATVMERSFADIIALLRIAANGNADLIKDIEDKEAHIKELFEDKIKLEVQLRKKRPPPGYKGRIVVEEIND